MKNIFYSSTLAIIISFFSTNLYSQAFQKGNKNFEIGVGLGAYATTTTFHINLPILGVVTSSTKDGAVSVIVPIGFEYGISNKIGIGAQLGFSNYFIDDSTEVKDFWTGKETGKKEVNNTKSVRSVDFAIKFNYHLLKAEKNDLFIGLGLGGSKVNWLDKNGETLTGSGSIFSIYITDRIFFSDHFGMFVNLGYTSYNYSNVTSSSNNAAINSLRWQLGGVNFGTGLALKF